MPVAVRALVDRPVMMVIPAPVITRPIVAGAVIRPWRVPATVLIVAMIAVPPMVSMVIAAALARPLAIPSIEVPMVSVARLHTRRPGAGTTDTVAGDIRSVMTLARLRQGRRGPRQKHDGQGRHRHSHRRHPYLAARRGLIPTAPTLSLRA